MVGSGCFCFADELDAPLSKYAEKIVVLSVRLSETENGRFQCRDWKDKRQKQISLISRRRFPPPRYLEPDHKLIEAVRYLFAAHKESLSYFVAGMSFS